MIAKIYKKMYIRNLPFRVIVPVCYQMRLNVVFSGLSDNKKNKLYGKNGLKASALYLSLRMVTVGSGRIG